MDIWDERPVLIHDEECNYVKFKGQLDFSSSLNQIVRIKSYDEYVEFEFHEKSGTFKTNKILRFKRDHFNTATLSKRLRPLREKYQTKVAVLYTSQ